MKKSSEQKIVIIGCGNLAWHLAKKISASKKYKLFIYNHQPNKNLADFKKLGGTVNDNLTNIINDAAFYFICIADKFIASTSEKITTVNPQSIVVHTSGSIGLDEIHHSNPGVFYPLQTFTKEDEISWKEIPILIETKNKISSKKLQEMAVFFSDKIIAANSKERSKIHLAAVFVNNFTNALYTAADHLIESQIKSKTLNFKLLIPLIQQTALKLNRISPSAAQTGPSKRKDKVVMEKHMRLLKKEKQLKKIYKQLSELISSQQK
ncbi:MAG: hypothetical protein JWO32_834 [Bacteroidetes bacterium]|nr:hypothetical protein [Bacteroidota bacterium]